jgi:CheY-like chemotaxis protein
MVSVSDTGQGMAEDVRSHIFEPFFTTKEVGKGTGLGLAMCFGIVKQSEGHIWAYSEPNLGTTITIHLPRIQQPGTIYVESAGIDNLPQGAETIIVAEDEDEVRELAVRVLQKQGYTVLEATNGEHALSVVQQSEQKIDLLITDVVMPKMGGKILAEQLKARLPNLKILFISGYAGKAIFHQTLLDQGDLFLSKPFVPSDLIRQVRIVLDD